MEPKEIFNIEDIQNSDKDTTAEHSNREEIESQPQCVHCGKPTRRIAFVSIQNQEVGWAEKTAKLLINERDTWKIYTATSTKLSARKLQNELIKLNASTSLTVDSSLTMRTTNRETDIQTVINLLISKDSSDLIIVNESYANIVAIELLIGKKIIPRLLYILGKTEHGWELLK